MTTVREWFAARRPLWAIYPTRRFAVVVLCLSVLWLMPGDLGAELAIGTLSLLAIAAGVDYVLLPGRHDVVVRRDIPPMLGLGDALDANIVIESHWNRPVRAWLSHELPATFTVMPAPVIARFT